MDSLKYEYIALSFQPRPGSKQRLLLFVAPATDIRGWAGVPRKAFDYQHGFQRTLNEGRVEEVIRYFKENENNISPTAVVLGLSNSVKLTHVSTDTRTGVETVRVEVDLPDLHAMPLEELAPLALAELRLRIPKATADSVDADLETAFAEALKLQDEDTVDETFGIESDDNADLPTFTESTVEDRSYLSEFYAQLSGYVRKLRDWPAERPLREILYSILKPAIIVDGQHRVFGAASADVKMLLPVCAITESNWAENVYQFVVINQKAKPIKPAFLSSIIATSLSSAEIVEVYDRLRSSKINVERAEVMDLINSDLRSPFRNMIDFEVDKSPGFLQFPGMAKLARDFQLIPRTHQALVGEDGWSSVEGGWLDHFFAFWTGIRGYFEDADKRLWREPTPNNPNSLLKIVSLQEVQKYTLETWTDSRMIKLRKPKETEDAAFAFWKDFPSEFFTDQWRQKGLQTSVGRRILQDALVGTRRNIGRRNWSHRNLKLFQE